MWDGETEQGMKNGKITKKKKGKIMLISEEELINDRKIECHC